MFTWKLFHIPELWFSVKHHGLMGLWKLRWIHGGQFVFSWYTFHILVRSESHQSRTESKCLCACVPLVWVDFIFILVTGQLFWPRTYLLIQCQIALDEMFWFFSINTSTTGCKVCIVMVKKLCTSCLPGFSWQLVLIIELWLLVRRWKADSVALHMLDVADLSAESCLFTHPDSFSIRLEMCLLPQCEFMSNI